MRRVFTDRTSEVNERIEPQSRENTLQKTERTDDETAFEYATSIF